MSFDWKHFVLSHLIWIAALAVAIGGFQSWRSEHDQHLLAEQKIAVDEQQVVQLQQNITANNQARQTACCDSDKRVGGASQRHCRSDLSTLQRTGGRSQGEAVQRP
jgi:hypothetical protein